MPNTRTFNRSFAGGEISPEMFGRIDDIKYQTGAAKVKNFVTKPQGPAENRPGFSYVREVKDSSKKVRLLSFTFSTTQTSVIELGDRYMRFHTQGQTLLYTTPAAWVTTTAYTIGNLVSHSGANYYCIADSTGNTPPDATYWYVLPSSPNIYEIPHPYLEAELFEVHHVQSADILTMVHPNHPPIELRRYGGTDWRVNNIIFDAPLAAPGSVAVARYIPSSSSTNADTYETMNYKVTAVSANLVDEGTPSAVATVEQNIYVTGAVNTITWAAVTGAATYRVYRDVGGLYGYIGETELLIIEDNNIAPDFSKTPPIFENDFVGSGNYPGAVSYFEQRRCFAGTIDAPQKIWMTKSGTESNLSYGLPIKDDDRIEFRVAAREANTIRHIVPLAELVLLTGSAEWRVTSVNSDAITPTTISVRPQSYIGSSNTQPQIINNSMVYVAARGGHIRELGYDWQANGFVTGDLSLRAAHLFDNYTVPDMAFSKSPLPIVWFISSSGNLIGLTYVPEQQIGAWHWHDTDGTFESVATVAESNDDVLYSVIKRTINGAEKRYVERMGNRNFATQRDSFFVDSGATINGVNTSATTMTVTGGSTWTRGESVTITSSTPFFNAPPSVSDVGDAIVLVKDGVYYRLPILATTSTTVATVKLENDLPASLRSTAVTAWEAARDTISGLTWLEGKTVSILADGAVHPQRVVTSGTVTLDIAASIIHIGLPYNSDLQTLPLAIQIEGYGQGRVKNVNHAWLRVFKSSGIFVGPDEDHLVEAKQRTTEPYGSPPSEKTEEVKLMLTTKWQDNAQVFVRQSDPLPLTIVGLTLETSIGG